MITTIELPDSAEIIGLAKHIREQLGADNVTLATRGNSRVLHISHSGAINSADVVLAASRYEYVENETELDQTKLAAYRVCLWLIGRDYDASAYSGMTRTRTRDALEAACVWSDDPDDTIFTYCDDDGVVQENLREIIPLEYLAAIED